MKLTRRDLFGASLLGAGGCLLPQRPPPSIPTPSPLSNIPRPRGDGLMIGAAKVDITPPENMPIWLGGFGFQRKMREIRDPLSAQAIVIDDGEKRIALVIADVIGLMQPTIDRVRHMVGDEITVAVASTHNHQSPDTIGFWGPAVLFAIPYKSGINPQYLAGIERRMAFAVAKAARSARPVEVRAATATLPPGINKNIRPPLVAPDDLLVVQAIDRATGENVATLIDFACHVETLGSRNHRASADFPGALRARLDETVGGVTVFANGSLGGMVVPAIEDSYNAEERSAAVERIGLISAEAVRAAIAEAKAIDPHPFGYVRQEVDLPADNDLFQLIEHLGLVEPRRRGKQGFLTEVGRIDLGPVSYALLPGEPTPLVGTKAKEQLRSIGATMPAVIGLANDELGYLLDPEAEFDNPEFSYEVSMSVGRAAAPWLLAALSSLPKRSD